MILSGENDALDSAGISVFAYDPGETSGWAWCCVGRRELLGNTPIHELLHILKDDTQGYQLPDTRFATGEVKCHVGSSEPHPDRAEDRGAEELYYIALSRQNMAHRVSRGKVNSLIVVGEDFQLRERTMDRSLLSPVRLFSKVEMLFFRSGNDVSAFIAERQTASDAKATCTDDRMRAWGHWQPGKPHATDATRHLIIYLRKVRKLMHA